MPEYYLNIELYHLSYAKHYLEQMTDNDSYSNITDERLLNNLRNGINVITHLSCYLESFIDTIFGSCMAYQSTNIGKFNTDEKLEIIFMHYQKDIDIIKSSELWETRQKAENIKNELMISKKISLEDNDKVLKLKNSRTSIKDFFQHHSMVMLYEKYQKLCQTIAITLELKIKADLPFITDGDENEITSYVYDEKRIVKILDF